LETADLPEGTPDHNFACLRLYVNLPVRIFAVSTFSCSFTFDFKYIIVFLSNISFFDPGTSFSSLTASSKGEKYLYKNHGAFQKPPIPPVFIFAR